KGRQEMRLNKQELRPLVGDRVGARIQCVKGTLWVTQENDPNDHVLESGDQFTVTLRGKVVVQAMKESFLRVSPPEAYSEAA
ncbi:MAG: DUF2917 domain-containing protein, partial [Thermodesulfobacteriota bacterium]